ncbi:uncharacterized protein [Periplaneta americana]|uniref:uncharacterized protein isoform X2 n=1 Tax=Periplaneta americana TaxID=6978 RepID=UPI0037E81291
MKYIMFSVSGMSNCTSDATNFTWIELMKETGRIKLEFNMSENFCSGRNEIHLEVMENVTEEECNGTPIESSYLSEEECSRTGFEKHSLRTVRVRNGGNTTDVKRNVTFNMIYKGCYRVTVVDWNTLRKYRVCSPPKFIESNVSKENVFSVKRLTVVSEYVNNEDVMKHIVGNLREMHVSKIQLTVRACDKKECNCTSGNKGESWIFSLNATGDIVCRRGRYPSHCNMNHGGREIECWTANKSNHSQCILAEILNDHPCNGIGVWADDQFRKISCTWNSHVVKPTPVPNTPISTEDDYSIVITITIILTCLMTACVGVLIYVLKRPKQPLPLPYLIPLSPSPFSCPLPQILLLYSRDCKAFMDLMATFRSVLMNTLKCEVHDCYDSNAAEEVASGSLEWLTKYLTREDTKVIVVESECAVFRQRALFQGVKIVYKDPSWLDDIFLHGLKDLANDKRRNQYNRVFVVRINGFTDENERIRIINPNTRYIIPQHLEDLFTSLCRLRNAIYSEDLKVLEEDIKSLERYKRNNKNYLDQLLRRT